MNLSAIMKVQDQATRQLLYMQQQQILALQMEIEALKKPKMHMKGVELPIENMFNKVV